MCFAPRRGCLCVAVLVGGGGGGHIACLGEMCGVGLWLCSRSADWVRCVGEQMDSVPFAGEGGP